MERILIISELPLIKTFIFPTVSKLKQEVEVQFDCFVVTNLKPEDVIELKSLFTNVYFNKYPTGLVGRLPKLRFFQYIWGLRKLAGCLPHYDVAHINFHHYYYAFFSPIIRKKADRLFVTFFGSDFNEVTWYKHLGNKKTIALADHVFAINPSFLSIISKKYDLNITKKKTEVLFFYMENLNSFEHYASTQSRQLARLDWGGNSKIMTCGYNGSTIARHEEMIKVLVDIKKKLTDYCIVFPMTYGQNVNVNCHKVKSLLLDSGLNYQVLEEYLPIEKLLSLRLATDIFVHIQSRDQMSSSMLEHLAAGSVVITGKWLPYESLKGIGVYFIQIDKVEDLKVTLVDVIDNLGTHLEMCKKNRAIILNLTCWEKNKWSWYAAYNLIEE
jgi:hypothetical protein